MEGARKCYLTILFPHFLGSHLLLQDCRCPGSGGHSWGSSCCHHHLPGPGHSTHGQEECHSEELAVRWDPRLYLCHLLRQDRDPHYQHDVCQQGMSSFLILKYDAGRSKSSIFPNNSSTRDRRVWLGYGLWSHQSLWPLSSPTSKRNLYWRLVRRANVP